MNESNLTLPPQSPGFVIALAWPQTYCKQAGGWYDGLMRLTGFNRNYFYKAGHAALVLVDGKTGECHYFDFGRYHAPFAHGRVRSADTDHDLEIKTKAIISGSEIINFRDILTELFANESCHGTGPLYGSYVKTNFRKAYYKAISLQEKSPIIYGPFIKGGTNCSRFVSTVIRAGIPFSIKKLKVAFAVPTTPTPLNNVKNIGPYIKIDQLPAIHPTDQLTEKNHLKYA
jgi:hypothetical protein